VSSSDRRSLSDILGSGGHRMVIGESGLLWDVSGCSSGRYRFVIGESGLLSMSSCCSGLNGAGGGSITVTSLVNQQGSSL